MGSESGGPSAQLAGETAIAVTIRAYNTTGEVVLGQDSVLQGTRLILTCDVEGLPEGEVVISYKWYHSCSTGKCEIQEGHPYYTAVNDSLLVETPLPVKADQGGTSLM